LGCGGFLLVHSQEEGWVRKDVSCSAGRGEAPVFFSAFRVQGEEPDCSTSLVHLGK